MAMHAAQRSIDVFPNFALFFGFFERHEPVSIKI